MPGTTDDSTSRNMATPPRSPGTRPPPRPLPPTDAANGRPRPPFWRTWRFWLTVAVVALINWFMAPLIVPDNRDRLTTSYTSFLEQVSAGNVVEITSRGDVVQGELRTAITDPAPPEPLFPALFGTREPRQYTKFETTVPAFANTDQLSSALETNQVVINARPIEEARNPVQIFLLTFGPAILLIAALFWVSSRATGASGRLFGIGQSRARRYVASADTDRVTFNDIAGIDEAEHELVEIVDFLRMPDKYARLGGRIPRGVLLIGAPGTGKTLLARAVAGEANVPFFSMSGSEFIEMIVGVGASRVRDLFSQAKAAAPAIIFVDELDAIGRKRGAGNIVGGHDEREQTLNQLLVEMDGFDSRQVVIVLGATNRADVLDPALLRPGRFDRRVVVQSPDREGRAAILNVHTRGVPLDPDVILQRVAAQTPGLVGADLANLVNEAALLAARRGQMTVKQTDFAEALERIALGAERKLTLSPSDRERVAYHEAGHALLGLLLPEGDPVRRVTVVPRGQALGVTLSVPDDDRYNYTEAYLRARIVSALGGRAAELIIYGDMTTGAENDLKQVTDLARAMVTRWGMSDEVGLVSLASRDEGNFLDAAGSARPYGEQLAHEIDAATRRIVDECYAEALELLRRERARLEALARALLRDESLDEQQILAVTGLTPKQPAPNPIVAAD